MYLHTLNNEIQKYKIKRDKTDFKNIEIVIRDIDKYIEAVGDYNCIAQDLFQLGNILAQDEFVMAIALGRFVLVYNCVKRMRNDLMVRLQLISFNGHFRFSDPAFSHLIFYLVNLFIVDNLELLTLTEDYQQIKNIFRALKLNELNIYDLDNIFDEGIIPHVTIDDDLYHAFEGVMIDADYTTKRVYVTNRREIVKYIKNVIIDINRNNNINSGRAIIGKYHAQFKLECQSRFNFDINNMGQVEETLGYTAIDYGLSIILNHFIAKSIVWEVMESDFISFFNKLHIVFWNNFSNKYPIMANCTHFNWRR